MTVTGLGLKPTPRPQVAETLRLGWPLTAQTSPSPGGMPEDHHADCYCSLGATCASPKEEPKRRPRKEDSRPHEPPFQENKEVRGSQPYVLRGCPTKTLTANSTTTRNTNEKNERTQRNQKTNQTSKKTKQKESNQRKNNKR